MKKMSKRRKKRKEVKLDKRLGLKSEECFLYFSLLYSKQVFDLSNLTLANFKQNEFSSSLVPFCLASLRSHTCWSLAERSRPSHPASPWIPALPAWVTAAVWPFGRLVIVHLSGEIRCKIDNLHPSVPSLVLLRNELPSTVLRSSLAGSLPPHWTQFCFLHGGVLLLLLWMTSQAFSCFRVTLAVCWVHLMSVCFLQGPVYELPSYVLTAVTLLLSWIWFLANVVQL